MENQKELILVLNKELSLEIPVKISLEELRENLSNHISFLIENNFGKLVSFLYRIDVNESKLKTLLHENADTNAGVIIAELIIERQLQKIKAREQFRKEDNDISEEEKW